MPDKDLKKRTFDFALAVGRLVQALPPSLVNRHYFSQLVRCSSSVGANYRAAQRAKSENDFINKLKIVEEEADESVYFLELLLAFNSEHSNTIVPLINEGTAILRIIVASINTIRQKAMLHKK
ncbi:MAG: four helix bundle protein [Chitinophagaceae bacterium]